MAAVVIGIIIGLALVFPIAELIRFFYAELTGWYGDMTLPEAFQAVIVVLLTVLIARTFRNGQPGETRGPGPVITPRPHARRSPRTRAEEPAPAREPAPRPRRASRPAETPAEPVRERRTRAATNRRPSQRRRVDTEEQEHDAPRRGSSRRPRD